MQSNEVKGRQQKAYYFEGERSSKHVCLKGRKAGFANREIGQLVIVDRNTPRFELKGHIDPPENAEAPVCIYASKLIQLSGAILSY